MRSIRGCLLCTSCFFTSLIPNVVSFSSFKATKIEILSFFAFFYFFKPKSDSSPSVKSADLRGAVVMQCFSKEFLYENMPDCNKHNLIKVETFLVRALVGITRHAVTTIASYFAGEQTKPLSASCLQLHTHTLT